MKSGFISFSVNNTDLFNFEAGGHRWQRCPPTEKGDRIHTSTITVAVLSFEENSPVKINPKDLKETFTRGSGAGGQHRNKTDTAVILKHIPTGLQVKVDAERSQPANRKIALYYLQAKLNSLSQKTFIREKNKKRRDQVGLGMRGDKIRTIALHRDKVIDHRSNKTMKAKRYMKGYVLEIR